MHRIALTLAAVVGAPLVLAITARSFDWLREEPPIESAIEFDGQRLGPAPLLIPVETSIPVTNTSKSSLSLRVEASCGCTNVEPSTLTLAPGECRRLTVRVAPSRRAIPDAVALTLVGEHGTRGELAQSVNIQWVNPFPDRAPFQSPLTLPLDAAYLGHALDDVSAYRGASDEAIQARITDDNAGVELLPPPGTPSIDVVLLGADFEGGKVVQRITLDGVADENSDHANSLATREEVP